MMCTVGIGDNMLLSKLALDLESKKTKSGIARWRYEDVSNKLCKVRPLSKMWGIGGRMERNLNRMGISTAWEWDTVKMILAVDFIDPKQLIFPQISRWTFIDAA